MKCVQGKKIRRRSVEADLGTLLIQTNKDAEVCDL